MSFLAGLGAIGSFLGGIGSTVGTFLNYKEQKKVNEQNYDMQKDVNFQNQVNFDKQFEYNKYLNANQYQLQSQDMIKAGVNPLAGFGGVSTSSLGSSTASSSPLTAPQLDVTSLLNTFMQYKIAKLNAKNNLDIAELNADNQTNIANLNNASSERISNSSISSNESIASASRDLQKELSSADNQTRIRLQNLQSNAQMSLQKAQQDWSDSAKHQKALAELQHSIDFYKSSLNISEFDNANNFSSPITLDLPDGSQYVCKSVKDLQGVLSKLSYDLSKKSTDYNTGAFNKTITIINAISNLLSGVSSFIPKSK